MDIREHHIDNNKYIKIFVFNFNKNKKHLIAKMCIDNDSCYSDHTIFNKIVSNEEVEQNINDIRHSVGL